MCIYLGIEDLAANALSDKQEQAVLVLLKERTNEFLHDYSDYFELFSNGMNEVSISALGI